MKLKEEWPHGAKNKGEPFRPTLIPLRALARRSGRFPPLPYPPPRLRKCSTQTRERRNHSTFVTVLIRRLRRANPCGSTPARDVPWTWPFRPGVKTIMERRGVPRDDRIDFSSVGRIAPERGRNLRSAGVHEGTGRGTVAR